MRSVLSMVCKSHKQDSKGVGENIPILDIKVRKNFKTVFGRVV